MSVETPNIEKALERFAHNVALNARRALEAKRKKVSIRAKWTRQGGEWKPTSQTRRSYLGNTIASGRLAESLKGTATPTSVIFEMDYYGYWIDQGRKPSRKFPPPVALREWIQSRKIRLRDPATGKYVPQTEQAKRAAAFLFARKVKAFGIPATGFFSNIFLRAYDKLPYDIQDALLLDIDLFIQHKSE